MQFSSETEALFASLRQSAKPEAADAIESLVREAPDRELCRVNALAFAAKYGLDLEDAIAAFLHAARHGLFELAWTVLCPGCGGVLDSGTSLRTVHQSEYACALCAAGYEPTLDEMVEVTFTVSPYVRRIAAHDPQTLPINEYYRQIFCSSGVDLPDEEALDKILEEVILDSVELPPGEKATISLQLPAELIVIFDPVVHMAQFVDVKGEPTRERRTLSYVLKRQPAPTAPLTMQPGPLRILFENRADERTLPSVWVVGNPVHDLMAGRRPFLTAKRMLTNQTFRDIYRTETLDYDRVGDLVAYDLVRQHFRVMNEIAAAEAGAVVKTIGDAVMATFPTADRALAAALRMREAVRNLNKELLLKIGIHEGPCLAVMQNDRQDYFGQTVNIASRVQELSESRAIFATERVVEHIDASKLLEVNGIKPMPKGHLLRGVAERVTVFEIP
jgi:hypothetical protein